MQARFDEDQFRRQNCSGGETTMIDKKRREGERRSGPVRTTKRRDAENENQNADERRITKERRGNDRRSGEERREDGSPLSD
jgi:hypothetical protein